MTNRENNPVPENPLGMDGIEFIEYATAEPLALGAILERMGFVLIARHRSREVVLYRQGDMNIIVNADPEALVRSEAEPHSSVVSAIALRVRDAGAAYRHAVDMGAWAIPTRAGAMELNIPGVHGAGDSIFYFVDRYQDFSIYDVDFKPLRPDAPNPPAIAGMHFFGVVQAIRRGRVNEWIDFYQQLLAFRVLPEGQSFGVMPRGTLLRSPCGKFYMQLVEPPVSTVEMDWDEGLIRIGFGAPDVVEATRLLKERGIVFVDRAPARPSDKGALTQLFKGGVSFELVQSKPAQPGAMQGGPK
ncbi:MAG: 4-hydroxyphenylpyruvate dioxygenase [Noviherbaspirillum sp.]